MHSSLPLHLSPSPFSPLRSVSPGVQALAAHNRFFSPSINREHIAATGRRRAFIDLLIVKPTSSSRLHHAQTPHARRCPSDRRCLGLHAGHFIGSSGSTDFSSQSFHSRASLGGVMVRASDSQQRGRGFESRSRRCELTTLASCSHTYLPLLCLVSTIPLPFFRCRFAVLPL